MKSFSYLALIATVSAQTAQNPDVPIEEGNYNYCDIDNRWAGLDVKTVNTQPFIDFKNMDFFDENKTEATCFQIC